MNYSFLFQPYCLYLKLGRTMSPIFHHFRDSVTEQLLHMTHNTQIKNSPCSTIVAIQFKYTDPVVLLYATYISTHLLCELVNHK